MPHGGNLTIATANMLLDDHAAALVPNAQPGSYVVLTVSDTGHGMDANTKARIFDPFFTTKKMGHGTGLGLSSVFGIVTQHNGYIAVHSQPGQGATFEIYLPRQSGQTHSGNVPQPAASHLTGTETILVVEDEAAVRQVVCTTLKAHGYHTLEATSPTHALKWATEYKEPIHLLLTDVIMPEMNGFDLYQQMTAILPHLRVLYTSGYTNDLIPHQNIRELGVNFLPKPFTPHGLLQIIRQVLA
jgi:two-component system cell cycle sensor histidine kinase/response regulator CckA